MDGSCRENRRISPDVLSALRSGQTIGSEIEAASPEHKAWVEIHVHLDPLKGTLSRNNPKAALELIRYTDEDPIAGYTVRHLEVPEEFLKYFHDHDLYATIYDDYFVPDTEHLEGLLSRWLDDLSVVRVFEDYISEWYQKKTSSNTQP